MSQDHDNLNFSPPAAFQKGARIKSLAQYREMHAQSIKEPEKFWAEQAKRLDWIEPWKTVSDGSFTEPRISWFNGGKLNVSVNCLDRHIEAGRGDQTAIIWEGNEPLRCRTNSSSTGDPGKVTVGCRYPGTWGVSLSSGSAYHPGLLPR